MTNEGTFPSGRTIFFEKISGILFQHRENKFLLPPPLSVFLYLPSVSGEETDFISFQQGRTDFQSLLTANRFIASFFLSSSLPYSKIGGPDRQRILHEYLYSQKLEPRCLFSRIILLIISKPKISHYETLREIENLFCNLRYFEVFMK